MLSFKRFLKLQLDITQHTQLSLELISLHSHSLQLKLQALDLSIPLANSVVFRFSQLFSLSIQLINTDFLSLHQHAQLKL